MALFIIIINYSKSIRDQFDTFLLCVKIKIFYLQALSVNAVYIP